MITYEEMSEAYETAATPEEKKIAEKRLNTFEANVEKANLYYEDRDACNNTKGLIWYCSNAQSANLERIRTIEGKVRAYKRERGYCGCANSEDVMRAVPGMMY